jgi:hypothetical protein
VAARKDASRFSEAAKVSLEINTSIRLAVNHNGYYGVALHPLDPVQLLDSGKYEMEDQRRDFHHPFTPYDIQNDFMNAVYRCIEDECVGVFESPTGTTQLPNSAIMKTTELISYKVLENPSP